MFVGGVCQVKGMVRLKRCIQWNSCEKIGEMSPKNDGNMSLRDLGD